MEKFFVIASGIIAALIISGALILGLGVIVEALWNVTVPDVFGLPMISYWQAVRLLVLAYLLVGGGTTVSRVTRSSE